MTRWLPTIALVAIVLGWAGDGFAHHSTGYYSKEQKDFVKLQGKVVRWEYRSPHSQLYVEAADKDGKLVVWRFESTPAAWLLREGVTKESISVGDLVIVEGFPIPGQPFAWLGMVTKADGTRLRPQRSSATPDWWNP
jgi:exopolysaccharide biosynthesis protein